MPSTAHDRAADLQNRCNILNKALAALVQRAEQQAPLSIEERQVVDRITQKITRATEFCDAAVAQAAKADQQAVIKMNKRKNQKSAIAEMESSIRQMISLIKSV